MYHLMHYAEQIGHSSQLLLRIAPDSSSWAHRVQKVEKFVNRNSRLADLPTEFLYEDPCTPL